MEDLKNQSEKSIPPVLGSNAVPPVMNQYPRGADTPNFNSHDDPMRFVIPLHTSGWAVAAGYVGLFSILALPAPIAIFLGVMALRDIKQNPNKNGIGRAWFAIVIGTIFSLFFAYFLAMSLTEKRS